MDICDKSDQENTLDSPLEVKGVTKKTCSDQISQGPRPRGPRPNSIPKPFSFNEVLHDDGPAQKEDSPGLEIDWSRPRLQTPSEASNSLTPLKGRKRRRGRDGGSSSKKNSPSSLTAAKSEIGLLSEMEDEIEKQLNAKALKSNLTVVNVKNILKHVLTNEQVLAMVRHTMHEGDNLNDDESLEDVPIPKLTRSKTKELLQKQPEIAWSMTPTKRPVVSECQALIDQDLPEDSSDEEYQPNEEDLMSISDFDLESQPNTPFSASTPRPPSNLDCSTQTSASWIEDATFRTPLENIGQRTRSKLSLSDTALETIEMTLVPPDITTDMYELECDDDDWKDFLKQFAEPLRTNINDTIDDDDEADPEYNLLADEDAEDVDHEELRMDRGVKVSKKELNQLMTELMDMYEDYQGYEPVIRPDLRKQIHEVQQVVCGTIEATPTKQVTTVDDKAEDSTRSDIVGLSLEQQLLLAHQLRKHVQLTAQHFVQTYGHPELSPMAQQCKEQLEFLQKSARENRQSSLMAANLEAALKLVQNWEDIMDGPSSHEIKQFINKELTIAKTYRKTRRKYISKFPTQLLDLVSKSKAIIYPLMLPPLPFRCDGFFHTSFFSSEDHLIAIGLEVFIAYVGEKKSLFNEQFNLPDALLLVSEHLLPTYDLQVLMNHVQKERKSKIMSPIKYYFLHKKAPGTDHFVVAFDNKSLKPLHLQPPELLPTTWKKHNFPGYSSGPLPSTISFHSTHRATFQAKAATSSNVSVVYVPTGLPTIAKYPH